MLKKIMILAGESSGDTHAASLIQALKRINPEIEIFGIGGQKMRQAGAKIHVDISELAIIGFTDVLKNFKKLKQVFKTILERVDAEHPQVCVLVDYPGFNLKLAKQLKKRAIPVIYYISPQIWAWWKSRVKTIKRFVDRMIVLFKFEQALYKENGIDVSFVGHPLLDQAQAAVSREAFLQKLGLSAHKKTIGLVPGSRIMEIKRILPILLQSAQIIKRKLPDTQFALLQASGIATEQFSSKIKNYDLPVVLCANQTYDFLNCCDIVLVASGTATLETAIMQKPMLIIYKVSFLNWLIAKCLIKLPYIGLVNVVLGKKVIPEFIQYRARPELIARQALAILNNPNRISAIKLELQKVHRELGQTGASQRAAEIISTHLEQQV